MGNWGIVRYARREREIMRVLLSFVTGWTQGSSVDGRYTGFFHCHVINGRDRHGFGQRGWSG